LITKSDFVAAIESMARVDDYQNAKNSLYKKHNVDGYLIEPDNNEVVLKLLKLLIPEDTDFDAVTTFCLEKNYGHGKANQEYTDPHGIKHSMKSPEELYDYLFGLSTEGAV